MLLKLGSGEDGSRDPFLFFGDKTKTVIEDLQCIEMFARIAKKFQALLVAPRLDAAQPVLIRDLIENIPVLDEYQARAKK
jgi:hypothetical protein